MTLCTADLELQDRLQEGDLDLQLILLQPEKVEGRLPSPGVQRLVGAPRDAAPGSAVQCT